MQWKSVRPWRLFAMQVLAWICTGFCAPAAEQAWEVRGEFVGFKAGSDSVVVLQLPDKTRIEVPLAALSEAGRASIEAASTKPAAAEGEPVVVRGPLGKSVTLAVPPILKAVETDAIWCRDAAEAVLVYELFLAGDSVPADTRAAAGKRVEHWRRLAAEKRQRQGSDWITPRQQSQIRREAEEQIQQGVQFLKLGNVKLAEAAFQKASRLDVEDGQADFILGLAFALSGADAGKPLDHFGDAVRRAPSDPWAVHNLAICEFAAGRYGSLVDRFRRVFSVVPQSQLAADNLGLLIANASQMRPKVPDRVVSELNTLYRAVVKDLNLKPLDGGAGRQPILLAMSGSGCMPGPIAGLPPLLEPPDDRIVGGRFASGIVVAPGMILTSRPIADGGGEMWVEDPAQPGRLQPAVEMASLDGPQVSMVRCAGMTAAALPLAERMPDAGSEVAALQRSGGAFGGAGVEARRGRIMPRAEGGGGDRFVHSAAVARGCGGGPIVDAHGRVVGIVAPAPGAEASGNSRGLGVPIDQLWPLLKEQIPDLEPATAEPSAGTWEEVERQAAAATVRVIMVERRIKVKAP